MVEVRLERNGNYWRAAWTDNLGQLRRQNIATVDEMTKRRAKAECNALAVELSRSPEMNREKGKWTLRDWCDHFLKVRTDLSHGTVLIYEDTIERLCDTFGDGAKIDRITKADAARWRASLSEDDGLADATVAIHARTARALWNEAKRQGAVDDNPFVGLPMTARVETRFDDLSAEQFERLLGACRNDGWRCLFGMCRWAGLRLREATAVKWQHVSFERRMIEVWPKDGRQTTKQKFREVPMRPELLRLLRDTHDAQEQGYGPTDEVYRNNLHREAIDAYKKAGITNVRKPFHWLRKLCETEWMDEHPVMTVCKWLGHSPTVAAMHYQRPTKASIEAVTKGVSEADQLRAEVERLKGLLEKVKENANG